MLVVLVNKEVNVLLSVLSVLIPGVFMREMLRTGSEHLWVIMGKFA